MTRYLDIPDRDGQELVLYWKASPSTRCVLVTSKSTIDLQLIREGIVERRSANVDPRVARDIARRWQVEYEIERRRAGVPNGDVCSECGDEAAVADETGRGTEQRLCQSCGHEWSVAAKAGR